MDIHDFNHQNHFDFAGIGGLTAAANLVKAGLRVLVLERNPHPGGTAYVYQRKGFTFPMGSGPKCHAELVSASNKINGLRDPETSSG